MERNTLEGRVGLFGPSHLTLCGTKLFFICLSILPGEVEASSRGSRAALISSIERGLSQDIFKVKVWMTLTICVTPKSS